MAVHWFVLVTLLLLALQGMLFRLFGGRGLTYERYFGTRACYAGQEVELVERIANRSIRPLPWLRLESLMHASLQFRRQANLDIDSGTLFQNHKSFFSLMPFTQITRRHRIVTTKRGCYRLNTATLTSGDLLGLYRNTLRLSLDAELLVYPRPAELHEWELPSHSWMGDISVRRWIIDDPFMRAGAREYQSGDPLSGIHWKATARSGRLQVHQRDYTADHRLMIYLNVEDHAAMWSQVNDEALFELGMSYAAGIAQYAIEQGMAAGFGTNACDIDRPLDSVRVEPRNGSEQLELLLTTMARVVVARRIPFDTFLEEEAGSGLTNCDILILSAYVSDKMELPMEQLRHNGNAVEVLWLKPAADTAAEGSNNRGASA
ncbi:DUF58 domain-containing protein [Paenibacillus rigui]|uniref:DUF58 domain-containing protein n=1 Tax=Paenibacillus rigui TaxID=554312 RepID=A0A229UX63_9BACL|nr:DUF58 domain-containing protein [Paenibacillus rigui]OXM87745.1 DUF58 domain-containing protein [Paenibacillus rigui]